MDPLRFVNGKLLPLGLTVRCIIIHASILLVSAGLQYIPIVQIRNPRTCGYVSLLHIACYLTVACIDMCLHGSLQQNRIGDAPFELESNRSLCKELHCRIYTSLRLSTQIRIFSDRSKPVLMDSLMGMCERVSDSRESAWLAHPCELRIRITDVLCPHHVGSAYGRVIRTTSRRLVNHCQICANPPGLRIHASCESASQEKGG